MKIGSILIGVLVGAGLLAASGTVPAATVPKQPAAVVVAGPKEWSGIKQGMKKQEIWQRLGKPQLEYPEAEQWFLLENDHFWVLTIRYNSSNEARWTQQNGPTPVIPSDAYRPKTTLKIPKEVRAEIQQQIQSYISNEDLKGVPLLDSTVDWQDFRNWPDRFTFQGIAYKIRLHEIDYDAISTVPAREFISNVGSTSANYEPLEIQDGIRPAGPNFSWGKPGVVEAQGFHFRSKSVFQLQYFEDGRLNLFIRDDYKSKQYWIDAYDKAGRLIGKERGDRFFWEESQVTREEFHKRLPSLWRTGVPGKK